jgi:acyl carrier protein
MDMQRFISDFEAQFEDVVPGSIQPDTELESLEEWNSLQAMVIISMIDSKYNVSVSGTDVNNAKTVADLYKLTSNKAS